MFLSTAIRAGKHRDIQLNKAIKTFLGNSWIELAARWILGVIFIYASYHKILAPADFAKIVYGYALFPAALINLIAIIVPFMELVAGFAPLAVSLKNLLPSFGALKGAAGGLGGPGPVRGQPTY